MFVPLSATMTAPAPFRTCQWLAACVSPMQSTSLKALASSDGVTETFDVALDGEMLTGVFGTVLGDVYVTTIEAMGEKLPALSRLRTSIVFPHGVRVTLRLQLVTPFTVCQTPPLTRASTKLKPLAGKP